MQRVAHQMLLRHDSWRRAGFAQLFSARNVKPLTVGLSLMLFQQITGQPSVLYYAGDDPASAMLWASLMLSQPYTSSCIALRSQQTVMPATCAALLAHMQ